jgi:hypothetical protein
MEIRSQSEHKANATVLGQAHESVYYNGVVYLPVDYEHGFIHVVPPPERTTWRPMSNDDLARFANEVFGTLFQNDSKRRDFIYMVEQLSRRHSSAPDSLLIKTSAGLKKLGPDGTLSDPTGEFIANTLPVMLNEDPIDQLEVFNTISSWLGDDEDEAHSLLYHLATALAPHWSAGKYLLLLGTGRNGKSLMMSMLRNMLGEANCSNVTRQQMADSSPVLPSMNNKLMNIVFDGQAQYVKDSANEKSLIVGESIGIRMLYSSSLTTVQTNGLFIEGLNHEPKSSDKSSALQARLVRFQFPNQYAEDHEFFLRMQSDRYVGALLALLLEHYVPRDKQNVLLKPTAKQTDLKFDHVELNTPGVQYLAHLIETDPFGAESLLGKESNVLYDEFRSWAIRNGDLRPWDNMAVAAQFGSWLVLTPPKSMRVAGKPNPVKVRTVAGFTKMALEYIEMRTGAVSGADDSAAVVED